MRKREKRMFIFLLSVLLLTMAGCMRTEECLHTFGALREAVPAGFFAEGNIAYYQCADCGGLFNEEKAEVESVAIPMDSRELSVCINGEPIHLTRMESSPRRIRWSLEKLRVEKGDVITICNADRCNLSYVGEGNLSDGGVIQKSALEAEVSVTATPEGLVLSVSEDTYPGMLVEINGNRYPMHPISYMRMDGFIYGYVELKAGDRFSVVDNRSGKAYGYADFAPDALWNHYDYHGGENGEIVIDHDARYLLKLSKDGEVSVIKVFAPKSVGEYRIILGDEKSETVEMQGAKHSSAQWDAFAGYATHEDTGNNADIAASIANDEVHVYSSVLTLKEGTRFYLENTTTAERIASDHITQVLGGSNCVELSEDFAAIRETGVYHIQYIPSCDSIWVNQLSTGGWKEAASQLDRKIILLPSGLEQYYADEIMRLYEEYRLLSPYVKYMLKASEKLETMYRNLLALESAQAKVIYYMNPEGTRQVYPSKEALFRAFYTDYYYYIAVYHGTDKLKKDGVKSLEDFLTLAQDLDGAGSTNLSGFGYVANKYFLISSNNNVLRNQPDSVFLGFCYQNGLYEELLPFLLRFFAYWRIDEHYAKQSNHGADPFAEPWATTVDIAKFFYYNEETTYVRTDRVLDCHRNTASVICGFDGTTQLPKIKLRGYIFEGWYDNPECVGNPVSHLDPSGDTVQLYAKWSVDAAQRDADAADLVDIYIYNLTTSRAVKNKATVGYVKEMYDGLTDNGKKLVKEYPALQNILG